MSTLDKILDRLHDLFFNEKKSISISSRLLALVVALVTITSVFPTLAEELIQTPPAVDEPIVSPTQTEEPSALPSATPDPTVTPITAEATPEATPEPSPSESEDEKVNATKIQPRISFKVPSSVAIDPRATVATLPRLSITGGAVGILCISGSAIIDGGTKNIVNDVAEGDLLIEGDLTPYLRIAGSLPQINAFINSGNGLKAFASQGRLSNARLNFRYTELTGAETSTEFCSKSLNHLGLSFRALGLQMDNVKTRIDFNKPSGK